MPAWYRIDPEAGIVFSVFEGRVTDEDLRDHQRRLSADPEFRSTMHQCVDGRGVTDYAVTAEGVRTVARAKIFSAGSRRALVAGSTTCYGYGRMFQLLRHGSGEQIQVFRAVESAHHWLGLPRPRDP